MTARALAALSARAYRHMQPWTEAQYAETLATPHHLLTCRDGAFVLGQVIADEAEILALACDPDRQRQGLASAALADFLTHAQARGATRVLLEVADSNPGAIGFYTRHGFVRAGLRRRYYHLPDGNRADALVMTRPLP